MNQERQITAEGQAHYADRLDEMVADGSILRWRQRGIDAYYGVTDLDNETDWLTADQVEARVS